MMRTRVPLLLLLGILFLASVSVSFGISDHGAQCIQRCESEKDLYHQQQCKILCKIIPEPEEKQQEEREHQQPHPPHKEKEGEREEEKQDQPQHEHKRAHKEEKETHQQSEKKEQQQESEEGQESKSERESPKNPFYFSSDRFITLINNQYGHLRVLPKFDQHSKQLRSIRDYRLVEFKSKPNTLYLPHHADADFLLVVLSGRVILTFVNPDGRDSYKLERGDAQKIPAGTIFYLINPVNNEDLRVIKLAMPINQPDKFEHFFLSSNEVQQSYLQGFSKNVLEASFDSEFEEMKKVLFGEEGQDQEGEQDRQEGVIVELSKKHIRQLSKHAKSSSKKTISSEDKPFNLEILTPIFSNKFGKFFEITPEKNPQLQNLNISLSSVQINEGGLLLPHFNSEAIVIMVVNEGEANIELVGLREQHQGKQPEESGEVKSYRAELSKDDIFVIPAGYPVAINATSNLNLYGFGINAENNQRNFLAGEKDNVMSQIPRQVLELAFPGSGEAIEKLIKNQRESYFADAQPQQNEEESKGRKGPLSSILGTLY